MVTAKLRSGRKHREHRGSNGRDRIHYGAGFRTGRNRPRATFLCVPLERIEPPTTLLERVVPRLVDGRRALEHTRVEQYFRFAANNLVVLFDRVEAGNGPRVEYGASLTAHEISEKEIQRRKQQDVIGKIFVQRKPVAAPL